MSLTSRMKPPVAGFVHQHLWRLGRFDPAEAMIVCGDPRGGSTWITEVLASIPRTSIVWEPLDINRIEAVRNLGFSWRQHIPEDASWPEAEAYFDALFRGKILRWPLTRMASVRELVRTRHLLFKFTRANALLPWLTQRFQFLYDPVYIVRHPFAVVASQLKHGSWDNMMHGGRLLQSPFSTPYRQHAEYLEQLGTREEQLTALWCLTNPIALDNPRNDRDWITIFYEEMLMNPVPQVERVFSSWGVPMPELTNTVRAPSSSTKEPTFQESVLGQLTKWQRQLDDEQVARMAGVLNYFEIDIYSVDPMPKTSRPSS